MIVGKDKGEIVGYVPTLLCRKIVKIPAKPDEMARINLSIPSNLPYYASYYDVKPYELGPVLIPTTSRKLRRGQTTIRGITFRVSSLSALSNFFHRHPDMVLLAVEGREPVYNEKNYELSGTFKVKEILWEPGIVCRECGRERDSSSLFSEGPLPAKPICKGCFVWWTLDNTYTWGETIRLVGRRYKLPTRRVGLFKLIYPEGYSSYKLRRCKEGLW